MSLLLYTLYHNPFVAFVYSKSRLTTRLLFCLCLQIVGITSPCLDADSSDARLRQTSVAALREELEWGIHLGLQACILPLPHRLSNANFAHVINQVSNLLLLGCVLSPFGHKSALQDTLELPSACYGEVCHYFPTGTADLCALCACMPGLLDSCKHFCQSANQ